MKSSSILTSVVCLLAAVAFTGCGDPTADFVGVYVADGEGELKLYADGYTYRYDLEVDDNINVLEGTSSDLTVRLSKDCTVPMNVDEGGVAYVVVGATCTINYGYGVSEKWTFQSGSARVARNSQLELVLDGDVVYSDGEQSIPGDFEFDLNLSRVAH